MNAIFNHVNNIQDNALRNIMKSKTDKTFLLQDYFNLEKTEKNYDSFHKMVDATEERIVGINEAINSLLELSTEQTTYECEKINEKIKLMVKELEEAKAKLKKELDTIVYPCQKCKGTGYVEYWYREDDTRTIRCDECNGAGY